MIYKIVSPLIACSFVILTYKNLHVWWTVHQATMDSKLDWKTISTFSCRQLEHPRPTGAHFGTPHLLVNCFQSATASIASLWQHPSTLHMFTFFCPTLQSSLCTWIINPCVVIITLLILLHTSSSMSLSMWPYHTSTNVLHFLEVFHTNT